MVSTSDIYKVMSVISRCYCVNTRSIFCDLNASIVCHFVASYLLT